MQTSDTPVIFLEVISMLALTPGHRLHCIPNLPPTCVVQIPSSLHLQWQWSHLQLLQWWCVVAGREGEGCAPHPLHWAHWSCAQVVGTTEEKGQRDVSIELIYEWIFNLLQRATFVASCETNTCVP